MRQHGVRLCGATDGGHPGAVEFPHPAHFFGETAFHTGRYEEAAKAFQIALSCEESDGLLRGLTCFCRARAFRKRGLAREAIECYQEAQRLAPDHAPSFFACGVALQELGRHAEALRHYERASALTPTHAPALCGMASCLEAVGRAPEAVDAYRVTSRRTDSAEVTPAVLIERSGSD
jgi:tetratricopeptide (TPR) repeat protein